MKDSPWWKAVSRFAARGQQTYPWLAPFQVLGVRRLCRIFEHWSGALLADDVGLGKTRMALAVSLALGCREPYVIGPAHLREEWKRESSQLAINIRFFSHASIGSIPLEAGAESLWIVDEAHRLRNPGSLRHRRFQTKKNANRVLLLSATLLHNSTDDLRALLALALSEHECRLAAGGHDATDEDSVRRALAAITVRRTRSDAAGIDAALDACPSPVATLASAEVIHHRVPLDPDWEAWLVSNSEDLMTSLAPLSGDPRGLFRTAFFRAGTSSPEALRAFLTRARSYLYALEDALRSGGKVSRAEFRERLALEDTSASQLALPFWFRPDNVTTLDVGLIREARARLERALEYVKPLALGDLRDVSWLLTHLREVYPALVFTEYRSTARAAFGVFGEKVRTLLVSGDGAWASGCGRVDRQDIRDLFNRGAAWWTEPASALVLTPLGAEGWNLQRARSVVHLDLPWTPARVEQRIGRAHRIGGPSKLHVFMRQPSADLEGHFSLPRVLQSKEDARVVLGLISDAEATSFSASSSTEAGDALSIATRGRTDSQRLWPPTDLAPPYVDGDVFAGPSEFEEIWIWTTSNVWLVFRLEVTRWRPLPLSEVDWAPACTRVVDDAERRRLHSLACRLCERTRVAALRSDRKRYPRTEALLKHALEVAVELRSAARFDEAAAVQKNALGYIAAPLMNGRAHAREQLAREHGTPIVAELRRDEFWRPFAELVRGPIVFEPALVLGRSPRERRVDRDPSKLRRVFAKNPSVAYGT